MKNAVQSDFKVLIKKVNSSENRHSEEIEGRGHLPFLHAINQTFHDMDNP